MTPQPFEVDVELALDLAAGRPVPTTSRRRIDYGRVFETCRQIVESTRFHLIEALAEAIAHELLAELPRRRGHRPRPQAAGATSAARSAAPASRSGGAGPADGARRALEVASGASRA